MFIGALNRLGVITRAISAAIIPTGAIQQRDGSYILDRAGNYIEVRA